MKNILKWIGGVLLMLFVALCKVSKVAERNLNHVTQMTEINVNKAVKPKSVIRISLCRTAKRNPLIFPI